MKTSWHFFSSWALACIIDNAIFYGHSFGCSRLYIIIVLANKVDMYELFRPFPISYTIIKALIKLPILQFSAVLNVQMIDLSF